MIAGREAEVPAAGSDMNNISFDLYRIFLDQCGENNECSVREALIIRSTSTRICPGIHRSKNCIKIINFVKCYLEVSTGTVVKFAGVLPSEKDFANRGNGTTRWVVLGINGRCT